MHKKLFLNGKLERVKSMTLDMLCAEFPKLSSKWQVRLFYGNKIATKVLEFIVYKTPRDLIKHQDMDILKAIRI